ncbi:hypothetical protein CATMQ487_01250 [Sphaerotilus microaerophilus]|uniref:Tetratricopeptide repeat protein n=2 Tax=Sphaerotilus microaerophilus TaxID=2914710 RepID=A0ABM7YFR1_9BURK|nr:hypothetical protein CATMQ487_01250 [Sphaerotilus sp. FB-5]
MTLLALAVVPPVAQAQATAAATPASAAASAPADGVRPELFPVLAGAQDLLRQQQFSAALAKLKEADVLGAKSPYEAFVTERLRLAAASGAGDGAAAERAHDALIAGGRLPAADRAGLVQAVLSAYYRAQDHQRSIDWARRLRQEPSATPAQQSLAQQWLAQSLYLLKDYAGAAREMQAELKAGEAAGQAPGEERLRLLASAQAQLKDMAAYQATLERLVTLYPKKTYWADLVGRVASREGFADRLVLDALRLKAVVCGGLDETSDVMTLAEMAQQGGQSIEARRWIQQAYASGQFGNGPQAAAQAKLRDAVQRSAADDEAALKGKGPAVKEALAQASWGQSYIAAGQTERGLAMMEEALAKGSLKRPDEIRLRLGAAYAQAGQADKAVRTLQAVQGSDGSADLARLWLLHLKQPVAAR